LIRGCRTFSFDVGNRDRETKKKKKIRDKKKKKGNKKEERKLIEGLQGPITNNENRKEAPEGGGTDKGRKKGKKKTQKGEGKKKEDKMGA